MTTAITTTTDATTTAQTTKKAPPSSAFDDASFFADAIDQALHGMQAMRLSEEAHAVLRMFSERGGLGHGSLDPPFRAYEVVAFFQLLAATAEAEKIAIFTEVADTISEACRLEGLQDASPERLELFAGYLKGMIETEAYKRRLEESKPAKKGARDTHATMRRSGPLAFLGGDLPGRPACKLNP